MPPGGGIHTIKISASLAQDLVGLAKLAVLPFQRLELGGYVRGQARLAPAALRAVTPSNKKLRQSILRLFLHTTTTYPHSPSLDPLRIWDSPLIFGLPKKRSAMEHI
jgi:hypothetical protein